MRGVAQGSEMKTWPFKKLKKYLKKHGYEIERTQNNEWKVVDGEGNPIEFFAVSHGSGDNRGVKAPYIRKILQAIKDDGDG